MSTHASTFSAMSLTAPPVSCIHLTSDAIEQYGARSAKAAAAFAEQNPDTPRAGEGRFFWLEDFPPLFTACIAQWPLHLVAAQLQAVLSDDDDPAGFDEYCYMADVLREALANEPTPQEACRWRRALAWLKQAGAASYAAEQAKGSRNE